MANLLQTKAKAASTNLTWQHFQTFDSILFPNFHSNIVLFLFVLYSMALSNRFIFESFVPNIRSILKTRTT